MSLPVASATEGSEFQWIDGWLVARCGDEGYTGPAYASAWKRLKSYLQECKAYTFAQITRQLCFDYVVWRTKQGVGRNTALWDLRILGMICQEAVLRGLIPANPARCLKIKAQPQKIKPEIPETMLDEIAAAIETCDSKYKRFLRVSFAIARYHGCRIAETRFPLAHVNLASDLLTFHMKGGKANTVPIHPRLRPLLEELIKAGDAMTYIEPERPSRMSQTWAWFFKHHGFLERLPGITFHCLRVSTVTRLARAGVPETKAMRFVAHSSREVHRVYLRTRVDDLRECLL